MLLAWSTGLTTATLLDDPRRRFLAFGVSFGVATGAWLILGRRLRNLDRATVKIALGLGLIARLAFIFMAPAFSEDVFRYVYEGRLVWVMGPAAPFVFAPAEAPHLGVPTELLDDAWLRINHPEISTIYPPFAQFVFAVAGGLSQATGLAPLVTLKALLVVADLGAWLAIAHALQNRGRPATESLWYGLCPLVIWETAREGHADILSALGLAIGVWGFLAVRPRAGYIGFALAALAKLNGLVAMTAALRSTLRGSGVGLFLLLGLLVPFALAGSDAGVGLSQYATRWRAGDGVFSILLWVSEAVLGGDWTRVAGYTLTQHQLARILTGSVFVTVTAALLARRPNQAEVPGRVAWLLLILLLLSPTLHPWYALWLLPFAAAGVGPRGPMLTLIALSPLLHYAGHRELITGRWSDPAGLRAVVHGSVWVMLLASVLRRGSKQVARTSVDALAGDPLEAPVEPKPQRSTIDRLQPR